MDKLQDVTEPAARARAPVPTKLNEPESIEDVGEAVLVAVANLLKLARTEAEGEALRGLQEQCSEFLVDTLYKK